MSRASVRGLDKIPLASKLVLCLPFTFFVIDRFFDTKIRETIADYPAKVIYNYEFYRLFFAQFVEVDLYAFFACPIILFFYIRAVEQKIGSIAFLIDFIYKGLLIQLVFVFLCFLFYPLKEMLPEEVVNYGFYSMIIFYSASSAFFKPKQDALFLGQFCFTFWAACEVPILAFLSHLSGHMDSLRLITALLAAAIDVFILSRFISQKIEACGAALQNIFLFRIFLNRPDFYFSQYVCQPQNNDSQANTNLSQGYGVKIGTDDIEIGQQQQ